jgi:hypothetical protein
VIKRFIIAAVVGAALVGGALVAEARICNTTCSGSGQYQSCQTYCY